MIRLGRVPTTVNDAVLAGCLADLPRAERDAARRQLDAAQTSAQDAHRMLPAQRRRVVARAVLRRLLGARLGLAPRCVPLTRQPWGKPVLAQTCAPPLLRDRDAGHRSPAVHFSLSYTGDAALLALAQHPVGVDIEGVIPDDMAQVARHVYTEEECARLRGAQPDQAFLDVWAAKEAVLKFLGTGFRIEPRTLCVPPASPEFQPVCVAAIAPRTSCVVASWRMQDAVTVAVSAARAPSFMTWEHYAH